MMNMKRERQRETKFQEGFGLVKATLYTMQNISQKEIQGTDLDRHLGHARPALSFRNLLMVQTYLGPGAYGRVFISRELCDVWKITAPLMVFEGCDN